MITWLFKRCVVRAHDFDFPDVALDDGLVEADGLDEEKFETFFDDDFLVQRSTSLLRRVRRVEDGDFAVAIFEIVENIVEALLTNLKLIQQIFNKELLKSIKQITGTVANFSIQVSQLCFGI